MNHLLLQLVQYGLNPDDWRLKNHFHPKRKSYVLAHKKQVGFYLKGTLDLKSSQELRNYEWKNLQLFLG